MMEIIEQIRVRQPFIDLVTSAIVYVLFDIFSDIVLLHTSLNGIYDY